MNDMMASNKGNNNRGTCYWCIKAIKWIPVLFIVTIVVWSYYAYVIQLCLLTVESTVKKVIFLIFYHIFFVMFFWSYWQTIFTEVGRVPEKFKLPEVEYELLMRAETEEMQHQILETFSRNLPNTNRTVNGTVRYCEKCRHIKPDRAHHCSVCGECILKMDHHCPWVNNCVCFTNYKFFILFLGYSLIYCLYISLTSLQYFISFWRGDLEGMGRFHILFLFFVAIMFAISLISLFCYHCYLVMQNRTTLEAFRAPIFRTGADKYGFSLGHFNNFQEVFGDNRNMWFIPVSTSSGDGVEFPIQSRHQPSSYHSMDSIETSLGDGYTFPQRHVDEDTEQLLSDNQQWADENQSNP